MQAEGVKVTRTGIKEEDRIREILEKEGFRVYKWYDPPGTRYDVHTHPDREVRWVIRGKVTIGVGDTKIVLEEGDRLDLEPRVPHWAETSTGVEYIAGSK